jgi:hypothetical protein
MTPVVHFGAPLQQLPWDEQLESHAWRHLTIVIWPIMFG